jgi:hypothetical protein
MSVVSCVALVARGKALLQDEANSPFGCWKFEQTKETPGKCPFNITDTWFLCLNPTMGGAIQGTLSVNHNEAAELDKILPSDVMTCVKPTSNVLNMLNYDLTVEKSPKNDLLLSETHHNCTMGDCSKMAKTPLKGKLSRDADTLILTRTDGSKIVFKKFENKAEEKPSK